MHARVCAHVCIYAQVQNQTIILGGMRHSILEESCCLNITINNILCPLSVPSYFSLLFPYAPPLASCFCSHRALSSVPSERLLWWDDKLTQTQATGTSHFRIHRTLSKELPPPTAGRLLGQGAEQFCSASTPGECPQQEVCKHSLYTF